jgi:MFS family permease
MNLTFANTNNKLGAFKRRFPPSVWYLTVIGFINSMGFSLSLPYVALYLNLTRGIPMTLVGLIILSTGLLSAAVQLISGVMCDRIGRRPLLLASMGAGTLLFGVMALLIDKNAPVWAIVVAYTGLRGAIMMANPPIQSMVVDLCPREHLVEANGLLRIGGNLGWAVGPALGGLLLTSFHYSWLFGMATILRAGALLLALGFIKESFTGCQEHLKLRSIFQAGQDARFLGFTLLCLMLFVSMGQMSTTLSVYTVERAHFSNALYGSLLTLNGLMVVTLQYPVTRALARFSKKTDLMLGSVFYAVGYFGFSFVGPYPIALAAMAVVTMGEMTIAPTTLAVVGEMSPPTWRGRYMGFYGLSETIGVSTGPLVGGILLDAFPQGRASVWGSVACFALLAAFGFWRWSPYKKRVG